MRIGFKTLGFWLVTVAWLGAASPAQRMPLAETNGPATVAELSSVISAIVSHSKYEPALWGLKVVSLDTGRTLVDHNSRKLFSPASNCKLFVGALALDRLGPDYRIRTSLYSTGRPDRRGVVRGDVIVLGRGDPGFNSRRYGGDLVASLGPLVEALTNVGVRRIDGDLVADTRFFHGPEFGAGWAWEDLQSGEGASISPLSIEDNLLELVIRPGREEQPCRVKPAFQALDGIAPIHNDSRTTAPGAARTLRCVRAPNAERVHLTGNLPADSPDVRERIPVKDPGLMFVVLLKQAMEKAGIQVRGRPMSAGGEGKRVSTSDRSNWVEIGAAESAPLRELLAQIQKPSQNLYTDLLLAHVGETVAGQTRGPNQTSEQLGIDELTRFLAAAGIGKGQVILEEGSGLSRNNLASPEAICQLLTHMHRHRHSTVFLESLPVAGVDGTLARRMVGTEAAGNVRAKTGTLRWVRALSGYVTTAAGERLAFAVLLNRHFDPDPGAVLSADLDQIAILLARFQGRSDQAP